MPRSETDRRLNNILENIGLVWKDFGTHISKFTKISMVNSKKRSNITVDIENQGNTGLKGITHKKRL